MARNTSFLNTDIDSINNKLKLRPNPADDHIKMFGDTIFDKFDYKIIDFVGQIIKNGTSKTNEDINVSGINFGNYILQIKTESGGNHERKIYQKINAFLI